MGKAPLRLVAPGIEKRTVMPRRAKNADLRSREYLTEHEIERLMAAARQNRYGHRDATMILIGFRHGLRASEVVDLRWDQVDFNRAVLHVRRVKGGTPSVHPSERIGNASPSPPAPRERGQPLRVRKRAGRPAHDCRVCPDGGAGSKGGRPWAKGSPPYASARVRLRPRQRGPRYAGDPSLSWPPEHPTYCPVHGIGS